MKIRCLLKRPGGTTIAMGGVTYKFTQEEDGTAVCDVKNERHASRLLEISEAYVPADEEVQEPINTPKSNDGDDNGAGNGDGDGDGDGNDDDNVIDESEIDPESMDNDELSAWANAKGINPKAKKSIIDYARDNYDEELSDQDNCAALIRQVIHFHLDELAEETAGNNGE